MVIQILPEKNINLATGGTGAILSFTNLKKNYFTYPKLCSDSNKILETYFVKHINHYLRKKGPKKTRTKKELFCNSLSTAILNDSFIMTAFCYVQSG